MEFEDLVDDSTFFLLGTRSGRSLSEERSEPVEPWLRQPEMGWDERPGGSCGKLLALRPPCDHSIFHHFKVDSNRGLENPDADCRACWSRTLIHLGHT